MGDARGAAGGGVRLTFDLLSFAVDVLPAMVSVALIAVARQPRGEATESESPLVARAP